MKLPLFIRQIAAFGLTGLASIGLILALTALLHEGADLDKRHAYAIGLAAALVFNFWLNRRLVFRGTNRAPLPQFLTFVFASFIFRGLEYFAFLLLDATIKPYYMVNIVLVQGTSFFIKYCFYRYVVFSKRPTLVAPGNDDNEDGNDKGKGSHRPV